MSKKKEKIVDQFSTTAMEPRPLLSWTDHLSFVSWNEIVRSDCIDCACGRRELMMFLLLLQLLLMLLVMMMMMLLLLSSSKLSGTAAAMSLTKVSRQIH
jgi:hypothetical protein